MPLVHDVVIVGSGASGAIAAHELTRQGVSCVVLEAGPLLIPGKHITRKQVWELPFQGFGNQVRQRHTAQATEFNANMYVDDARHPYTYPAEAPYNWSRIRIVGGKTLVWGRVCFRMSDYDFLGRDHDGYGENWPLRLVDFDPYYSRVEQLLRVEGRPEMYPQLPDGALLEDTREDTSAVECFAAATRRRGLPVTRIRAAQGPLASSLNLLLPPALASGRLKIVPNAVAREISVDRNTGLANGVCFIDRTTGHDYHIAARSVVLAASCLESTRLLLNSGIGAASGVLGHYLFDHFYVDGVVTCLAPERNLRRDGGVNPGGYIPRFRNLDSPHPGFIRGYAFAFESGLPPKPSHFAGHGDFLRQRMSEADGAGFTMLTAGEVLPRFENHVRLNREVKDAWGIPVLHIEQRYHDNEHAMARDSMEVAQQLCREAGFEILSAKCEMQVPGTAVHDMGTCRMGADPRTSVLNAHNQVHDMPNLLVVDGSAFPSGGTQNPTLTIMALALRAAEHLVQAMRDGIQRPSSFEVAGYSVTAEPNGNEGPAAAVSGEGILAKVLPPIPCTPARAVARRLGAFFDTEQLRTMRHLAAVLFPAWQDSPGAAEAGAAEFLDTVLAVSLPQNQSLYREGIACLNQEARARYGKPFAELDGAERGELLTGTEDANESAQHGLANFLQKAKDDVFLAICNSAAHRNGAASPPQFYCERLD